MSKAYDIIGDIHGHADALERLLQKMGYRRKAGVYQHPNQRQAVFVGDFIDRGPQIRETLHLVKDMCDAGHARAVMGNHEFNAICFHTPHTEKGGFFRDHTWKEIHQHMATIEQFRHYRDEWQVFVDWFKGLPLWLDEAEFRVVHACWDEAHVKLLSEKERSMSPEFLTQATDAVNKPAEYIAVEELLKGKEQSLPEGIQFTDKDGAIRNECRIRWWSKPEDRRTYGDFLMSCPETIKNNSLPEGDKNGFSYHSNKPVFFGHYWLSGEPIVTNPIAVCLDYSVARGGHLVAFSLDKGILTWISA